MDLPLLDRVAQRADDVLLADDVPEGPGAVAAVERGSGRHGRPVYPAARPLPRGLAIAAAAGLGALLWTALGGVANFDAAFALAWAQGLGAGGGPDYAAALAPTPHPLQTVVALALAPLGAGAETGVVGAAALGYGAAVLLSWQLGRAWSGKLAAWLAAALVATAPGLAAVAARGYLDVVALALVLGAALVETRHRRAGLPVVGLLAAAGLLRPEAWLLGALYVWWLAPATPARRLAGLALATAAAPAAWLVADLLVTGDPLHSVAATRTAAESFARPRGLAGTADAPRALADVLGLPVLLAAAGGAALLAARHRPGATGVGDEARPAKASRQPAGGWLALLAASLGAAILASAAGFPMDARYVLVPACVLAVAGAAGLAAALRRPAHRPAAALLLLLLAAAIPLRAERLADIRGQVAAVAAARAEIRAAADCRAVAVREAAVLAAGRTPRGACVRLSPGAPRRSPTASRR